MESIKNNNVNHWGTIDKDELIALLNQAQKSIISSSSSMTIVKQINEDDLLKDTMFDIFINEDNKIMFIDNTNKDQIKIYKYCSLRAENTLTDSSIKITVQEKDICIVCKIGNKTKFELCIFKHSIKPDIFNLRIIKMFDLNLYKFWLPMFNNL